MAIPAHIANKKTKIVCTMGPATEDDAVLRELPKDVPVFVDFHAEATSEKITLAHYLDGRVTAVVGTHTHVQTSDA